MICTEFQQRELTRVGYYTYPLSKVLKNTTNCIFNTVDSIYANIDEQEISDDEIDPPLSNSPACRFNLYNLYKEESVEKFYVKDTSIRCKKFSVSPRWSLKFKQNFKLYQNFIHDCFKKLNEKIFKDEFFVINYIVKYYPWPKEFHNLQIPRMGFHYDTSILSNLISSCEGLVLANNTIPNNDLGVILTGTGQSLFPHCFHGVNNNTISKTRYTIASFMLKGKPQ